jgi:transcriptional regulator with XRE-family HTH domain
METIGDKIRRIRKSKGISQNTVSEICGITQPSYANIESGKTQNITIEIGRGIADALGLSFNELFEIEVPFDYASEESKRDAEKLLEMLNNTSKRIVELEKRIEEKDLLIDLLKSDNQRIKNDIIKYIKLIADYQVYALINLQPNLLLTDEQKSEIQKYVVDIIHVFGFQQFVETGIMSKSEMQEIANKNWKMWENSKNEVL